MSDPDDMNLQKNGFKSNLHAKQQVLNVFVPVYFPVNANHTGQSHVSAAPVLGHVIVQIIGHRPNTAWREGSQQAFGEGLVCAIST